MTGTEESKERDKIEAWFEDQLRRFNRGGELAYRDAWPIERLQLAGKLPAPLETDVLPRVLSIKRELQAAEKGPTSDIGTNMFRDLEEWLQTAYLPTHPGADQALRVIGSEMFGESQWDAWFSRLFYDYHFGTLG